VRGKSLRVSKHQQWRECISFEQLSVEFGKADQHCLHRLGHIYSDHLRKWLMLIWRIFY